MQITCKVKSPSKVLLNWDVKIPSKKVINTCYALMWNKKKKEK